MAARSEQRAPRVEVPPSGSLPVRRLSREEYDMLKANELLMEQLKGNPTPKLYPGTLIVTIGDKDGDDSKVNGLLYRNGGT